MKTFLPVCAATTSPPHFMDADKRRAEEREGFNLSMELIVNILAIPAAVLVSIAFDKLTS